jgi:hypothetical protein
VLHSRPAIWGGPTHPTPHPDLTGPEEGAGEGKPFPSSGLRRGAQAGEPASPPSPSPEVRKPASLAASQPVRGLDRVRSVRSGATSSVRRPGATGSGRPGLLAHLPPDPPGRRRRAAEEFRRAPGPVPPCSGALYRVPRRGPVSRPGPGASGRNRDSGPAHSAPARAPSGRRVGRRSVFRPRRGPRVGRRSVFRPRRGSRGGVPRAARPAGTPDSTFPQIGIFGDSGPH